MSEPVDETMAADRRVLAIAAAATVLFVAIGATSASVFAESACDALEPRTVQASALAPVTGDQELTADVDAFRFVFGAPEAKLAADGFAGFAAAGSSIVVRGTTSAVVDDDGVTAAIFDQPATVVGDGPVLYAVALANAISGQVDALTALTPPLTPLTCVDTAVVGSPLAFHLDARDGELLLLRVDEDAGDPTAELRGGTDGVRWQAPLQLPTAPPGVLAAGLTGRLGPDVVVVARTDATDGPTPVLAAFSSADGTPRWTADRVDAGDDAVLDVAGVTSTAVIVTLDRADGAATIVQAHDVATGEVWWRHEVDGTLLDVATSATDTRLAVRRDDAVHLDVLTADGAVETLHRIVGVRTGVVRVGADWSLATDGGVLTADGQFTATRHAVIDSLVTSTRAAVAFARDDGAVVVVVYQRDDAT